MAEESGKVMPIPAEILKQMKDVFGPDVQVLDMSAIRKERMKEEGAPVMGLTLAQAMWLLNGDWSPERGDIVVLREDSPWVWNHGWPAVGQELVVMGMRSIDSMRPVAPAAGAPMRPERMLLGFQERPEALDDNPEPQYIEYVYDHRFFKRVGTVYDERRRGAELKYDVKVPGMN